MGNQSESQQGQLEDLVSEIRELRTRVSRLEQVLHVQPIAPAEAPEAQLPATLTSSESPLIETVSAIPVLGRALLGIAGAYLLRAVTEFGTLSHGVGVFLGIAYAMGWLVLAARTPGERKLEVAMHGLTSVLVISPLLWEATIRFGAVSNWTAAGILTLFSVFGLAISWRKNLTTIAWITTLAGLITAMALLVGTRDVIPFTVALLAIALAVECCACMAHWLRERWVVAAAANLSVFLVAYLVTREGGLPAGYAPVSTAAALATQIALLLIYLASTVFRTLVRGFEFTAFEITQAFAAFLISVSGALQIAHGDPAASWSVAAFTLLTGIGCYVVSFAFLERRGARNRNFFTYSTFGVLLTLVGTRILLASAYASLIWLLFALAGIWIGGRGGRTTLRLHGALYLLLATVFSGLASHAASRLLDPSSPGAATPAMSQWVVLLAACVGYGLTFPGRRMLKMNWPDRLFLLVIAGICVWSAMGVVSGVLLSVLGNTGLLGHGNAAAATVGTVVLTAASVGMAWQGTKGQRFELVWLLYPTMLLAGYKLLTRDLRQEHTFALFVSLLCYGGSLVLLPRMLRKGQTVPAGSGQAS